MSKTVLVHVAAAFSAFALFSAAPASSGEVEDNVALCAAEASAQGLVAAGDHRAKFVKLKGATLKTVVIRMIPAGDGDSATVECRISKGAVTSAEVK